MEFKVSKNRNQLRFYNWDNFIEEKIEFPKKSKNVLIFLTYNLIAETRKLLNYLDTQTTEFDILVVDNNSKINYWNELKSINIKNNIIRTIDNLGGSGGYAVALEWSMSREYENILITEDDASPVQSNLVDEMFLNSSKDTYVTVSYKNQGCSSFSFHFTVYPLRLIREIGVPDPTFFMIHDDLEFLLRQRIANKKLNISENYLNYLSYTHPSYKPKKNIWTEYFGVRNRLFVDFDHSNLFRQIYNFSITIPYCWSLTFYNLNSSSLRITHYALIDYIFNTKSYKINKKRKKQFSTLKVPNIKLYNNSKLMELNELLSLNYSINLSSTIKNKFNQKTKSSEILLLLLFRPKLVLAGNYLSLSHPFFMLSDKIIFIDNIIDINDKEFFHTVEWENTMKLKYLIFILTIFFSSLNIFLIIPVISISRIVKKASSIFKLQNT